MSDNAATFNTPEPEVFEPDPAEVKADPKPERKHVKKPSADKYTPFSW